MHRDDPIDLSALALPPAQRARMAREVLRRAGPALARRPTSRSALALLAGWARPALAAAAVVAAISLAALAALASRTPERPVVMETVAEALRVPEPAGAWVVEERDPTDADLVRALEGDTP